jgi:N-acetylmuramoyl-L-alanine amidase
MNHSRHREHRDFFILSIIICPNKNFKLKMRTNLELTAIAGIVLTFSSIGFVLPVRSQQALFIAYPPADYQTTSDRIFLIGTASASGQVLVNGKPINRSKAGHFAPSFSLRMGENLFKVSYGKEELQIKVTRLSSEPEMPVGLSFAKDSLTPSVNLARLPNELICFSAVAPPNGAVSVKLADKNIGLLPQLETVELPPNSAILIAQNQPKDNANKASKYQGCSTFDRSGDLGYPVFQLSLNGETIQQQGTGKIEILSSDRLQVVEVTSEAGVARTGASTDYSRLTPLPKGTRASVTGKEGEWFRLDYGAWIKAGETKIIDTNIPPRSIIRSITSRQVDGATEIVFPLQMPVPVSVQQGEKTFTLTLYNIVAQTDTILLNDDPLIKRLDWQQITPTQTQYTFDLKSDRQWGYDLKYEGTSLILSLRHPPKITQQLQGLKILLDPGHGGEELGSRGPTGYPEKEANLVIAKLLKEELEKRGATVYLTRDTDKDVSLEERVNIINQIKPTIALSLHYNALPDSGDAMNTAGISSFWYHSQAHDLSIFLHNYLVKTLNRPAYGVFWNNLALTRPHSAPSVLLELGFMINPDEFEWITNSQERQKLATAIAEGLTEWFNSVQ